MDGANFHCAEYLPEPGSIRSGRIDILKLGLLSDCKETPKWLIPRLKVGNDRIWTNLVVKWSEDAERVLQSLADQPGEPVNLDSVYRDLSSFLPDNATEDGAMQMAGNSELVKGAKYYKEWQEPSIVLMVVIVLKNNPYM
jgi:hypothetical protein